MYRFHVFLSHKGSDKPAVRALKQALAEHGLRSWRPDGLSRTKPSAPGSGARGGPGDLEARRGHSRLIQEALRCRGRGGTIDACFLELVGSRQIEAQFTAITQHPDAKNRLAAWLDQVDLAPCQQWIQDPLLRRLF